MTNNQYIYNWTVSSAASDSQTKQYDRWFFHCRNCAEDHARRHGGVVEPARCDAAARRVGKTE